MRKIIDVEFVVDMDKRECWAGIRISRSSKVGEENAVIKLILSGMSGNNWTKLPLSLKDVDKLRKE